jgi:DNA-binding PadR family transcriptional regulator
VPLLLSEGQSHGYDLLVRLADFGVKVDPGGLYRTLRAFEREGLVRSRWETSDAGPARRTYGGDSLNQGTPCMLGTRNVPR